MYITRSSPPICPLCKGSRKIVELKQLPDDADPFYKMVSGFGFVRSECGKCNGTGTTDTDHEPDPYFKNE